jgi:hypothetical protein
VSATAPLANVQQQLLFNFSDTQRAAVAAEIQLRCLRRQFSATSYMRFSSAKQSFSNTVLARQQQQHCDSSDVLKAAAAFSQIIDYSDLATSNLNSSVVNSD